MKTLVVDIETAPNTAHVWGLWNNNVSLNQLRESAYVMCWAAKWVGEKGTMFSREVTEAWDLFNEADVVVGWNSKKFDVPWLNSEWVKNGMTPPSPYHQVDLCEVVKRNFRFPSNKLDYVAGELLGKQKTKHSGHTLWVKCMAEDEAAWRMMEKYNRNDVVLTERLFHKLKPWVTNLPSIALYNEDQRDVCPQCGGTNVHKRGFVYTKVSRYQRYQCQKCGRWSRGGKRIQGVDVR